jgi:hypothetical protein
MQITDIIALSIGVVIGVIIIIYLIINQRHKVIEWLKFAVTEAEKMLGEKTGQLKLRQVYDWFVQKFPFVAAVVPFRIFSGWVDVALETMRKWLEDNKQVLNYVENNEKIQS